MSNFKRGKRKNLRAGCILCKPHKANGAKNNYKEKPSVRRKLQKDENVKHNGSEMVSTREQKK